MDNNATQLSTTQLGSFVIIITLVQSQTLPILPKNTLKISTLRKVPQGHRVARREKLGPISSEAF
jgi:hypothetical protein